MANWIENFEATSKSHLNQNENIKLQYGTAGFRTKGYLLDYVFYRMGILASLRSKIKTGQSIGIMITASHNPSEDNGIKLIDPTGEMLEKSWEIIATELVQCNNENLKNYILKKVEELNVPINIEPIVFIGYDTRKSSISLLQAALDGLKVYNTKVINYKLLTTPMLHFFVSKYNENGTILDESEYYKHYVNSFLKYKKSNTVNVTENDNKEYTNEIYFDGANGVGAVKITEIIKLLNNELNIKIFNNDTNTDDKLNFKCGADFAKTNKIIPYGIDVKNENFKYLSVDGDADRIIYWYLKENNIDINLLDGDRIGVLFAMYINKLLIKCNLNNNIKIKVIQTAYTNGNCTNYIKNKLNIDVIFTSTGVKYLHHEALKHDIGIYFEANGHGTVLYSNKLKNLLKEIDSKETNEFLNFIEMTNETVGDSFSIMLLTETILYSLKMSLKQWYNLYNDLYNKLSTAKVKDRNIIKTINADTEIIEPIGMQDNINNCVQKYKNSRSFVRPSGTEDIVRIYVEAETENEVHLLTEEIQQVVQKFL